MSVYRGKRHHKLSSRKNIQEHSGMEVLNLVLVYLQNLMHADVTIHKEETDQVWFNEARSISDFNSHLMIGEIMCTSFLADWVERAGKDPVLMKVIMERFNQFNQLYRYDDNFGWTHRYLTIRRAGSPACPERFACSYPGNDRPLSDFTAYLPGTSAKIVLLSRIVSETGV